MTAAVGDRYGAQPARGHLVIISACSLPLRLPAAHPDYKEWLSAGRYLWAAAEKQYCNLILYE